MLKPSKTRRSLARSQSPMSLLIRRSAVIKFGPSKELRPTPGGRSVDELPSLFGSLQRDSLREAFGELHEYTVINGVCAAVEDADAAERRVGPGGAAGPRISQERDGLAIQCALHRLRREEIDVSRAREMLALDAQ